MKSKFEQFVEDRNAQRLYEEETLAFEASELVAQLMEEQKISRAELARKIGKSKSHITQLLSGSRNMTLKTFAEILFALNSKAELRAMRLNDDKPFHKCIADVQTSIKWSPKSSFLQQFSETQYLPAERALRIPKGFAMVA